MKHKLLLGIIIFVVLAGGTIAFLALHQRSGNRKEASNRSKTAQAGQKVDLATVKESETERSILLIGEARAYYSVTLYARVSGYMDQLKADIGDVVKQGQLLAHVESPEQEQAFNSARADAFNLGRIAQRMRTLRRRNLVSQQQTDQAVSNADVAQANLKTQAVIRNYQNIVAPFDGIISNRFVDPGWLLQNASGSQSASQPLFTVSQTDKLRIFVYVDQRDAPYVRVGDPVDITVPNQALDHYKTHVEMIAGELDPKTRTLLTELILDNPDRKIVAGSFVEVHMKVKTPQYFELPIQALVMRNNEAYVPIIDSKGQMKYAKIELAENTGDKILIRSGVQVGEKVALNIGNTLVEGQKVQAAGTADKISTSANASRSPSSVTSSDSDNVMTLEKSIDIAIHNATSVLETTNQYGLTAIQVLQAYGQFLPNLTLGGGYAYETGSVLYTIQGQTLVDARGTNASVSVSSVLNLFNGLSDYSGLKSALSRRSATEYSLKWSKEQVALDITQTYLQLVLDQEISDIAVKNLSASQARLKLLQGQEEVGSAAISDLYRQEAETSADQFTVTNDESRVHDDQVLLLRKLRIDSDKSYQFKAPPMDTAPSSLATQGVDQLIKNTLGTRSDERSNELLVDSTEWDVRRSESGYLPRLDLVFSRDAAGTILSHDTVNGQDYLNFNQSGLGSQLGNQVEYSIGLNLSWNIFDRFVTRYNVEQARTVSENTRIGLDDSRLQIQADIRTAYTNYGAAQKQIGNARVGLEAAQKSYEAIEGMYEVGSSSIVDVLTAQAALVQAQFNLAQSQTNLKLQEKTLQYATGQILNPQSF